MIHFAISVALLVEPFPNSMLSSDERNCELCFSPPSLLIPGSLSFHPERLSLFYLSSLLTVFSSDRGLKSSLNVLMNNRGIWIFTKIAARICLRSNLTKSALTSFSYRAPSCVCIIHPNPVITQTLFGSQTKNIFMVSVNFLEHTGLWAKF